jgi:hypothetical protein
MLARFFKWPFLGLRGDDLPIERGASLTADTGVCGRRVAGFWFERPFLNGRS